MALKWTFFLGVHGTITSALIKTYEQDGEVLRKFGTLVLAPQDSKQFQTRRAVEVDVKSGRHVLSLREHILEMNAEISRDEDIGQILCVNESFLGTTRSNVVTGLLYPKLKKSIKEIPQFFDNPWHTICFCVLPYHDFFERCYLDSPGVRKGIEVSDFKERVLRFERTWVDIIEEVTERLPNIGFRIWRMDNTREQKNSIEKILFNTGGNFLPNTIDFGSPFINRERKKSSLVWTDEEIEKSNLQFEKDWYHLVNGWSDYIIT